MMDKIKELMKKKAAEGFKPMSKMEQDSKLEMLDELENLADEGISKKMQKVTVAAPDQESLEAGLELAQAEVGEQESPDEMDESLPEMKEDMSTDEIDTMMKHLQDMKMKKMKV